MGVHLLLVLALLGPFCAVTRAVPTELPEHLSTHPTEGGVLASTQAAVTEGFPSSTALPPSTEPATTPAEATTQAVPEDTTVVVAETSTPDVPTAAQQPLTSDPVTPAAGTEEPTEVVETVQTAVGKVVEAEVDEEVVVEDDAVEGLGSGQVVGIVIGALLAVVIAVAVVIVVVRRMGKYSP